MPQATSPAPAATRPTPTGVFQERPEGSSRAATACDGAGAGSAGSGTGAATATAGRFPTGSRTIASDDLAPPVIVTVFEKSLKPTLVARTTARPSTNLTGAMAGNVPARLPSNATLVPLGPVTTSSPMWPRLDFTASSRHVRFLRTQASFGLTSAAIK